MAKRLEVLPEAIAEAVAATRWYLERDDRVAGAFEAEVTRAFREIVYKIYPDVVLIVAVAHCKRNPGYWRRR